MDTLPLVILGIAIAVIVIGLFVTLILKRKREGQPGETDYRAIFILGISFSSVGVVYLIISFAADKTVFLVLGLSFIAMGLSYLAIGLRNKDKWKKK